MREIIDVEAWRNAVADSLTQLAARAVELLPTLAGALLILLVGWGVSKIVAAVAGRVLRRVGFDRAAEQLRITEALQRAQITSLPSTIVARLLWWMSMLTFLLSALDTMALRAVSVTVDRLVAYLPNVIAALVIVVLGSLLGRFVQNLIRAAASMANLPRATQMGAIANAAVVLLTGILALEELGVETTVLMTVVTTIIATLGLTLGGTFALGARPLVTHILAGHALRQVLPVGRSVEIGGREGIVERVGAIDTLFRSGDRRWSMANARLLDEVIEQ